jgi:outer membrane protein assembly factor BamD
MSRFVFVVCFAAFFIGCASTDKVDSNSAEGAFSLGEKFEKDERYEEALTQYNQVKNKHPYSRYAVEAKLRIADIHYKREDWVEAQTAYQVFKEMHPKHPKIDYVTFRLAMCYFNQLPGTIDRDIILAEKAKLYFRETIDSFPNSEYASQAKDNEAKVVRMQADKEDYIGNFYFIREQYDSALSRYEDLLQNYPGIGLDQKALYRAAYSAYKIQDMTKAKTYYDKLVETYSGSDEAKKIKGELGNEFK